MGGSLYEDARRISTEEFNEISSTLVKYFEYKTDLKLQVVKFYGDKQSHGDIDILVFYDDDSHIRQLLDVIRDNDDMIYVKKNGNVLTFGYDEVQIDLILYDVMYKNTAGLFYDYNDFGLLIGKLLYYNNMKFSPKGILFDVRCYESKQTITVYDTPEKIFNFLGLDYNKYLIGFSSLEDMFEYVTTSKLFCKEAYDISLWNADQRKRDFKRPNLTKFYDYIDSREIPSIPRPTYKETFIRVDLVTGFTPKYTLQSMKSKYEDDRFVARVFNGNILMEKFPLLKENPKLLGKFIRSYKDKLGSSLIVFLRTAGIDIYNASLEEHYQYIVSLK